MAPFVKVSHSGVGGGLWNTGGVIPEVLLVHPAQAISSLGAGSWT